MPQSRSHALTTTNGCYGTENSAVSFILHISGQDDMPIELFSYHHHPPPRSHGNLPILGRLPRQLWTALLVPVWELKMCTPASSMLGARKDLICIVISPITGTPLGASAASTRKPASFRTHQPLLAYCTIGGGRESFHWSLLTWCAGGRRDGRPGAVEAQQSERCLACIHGQRGRRRRGWGGRD